MIFWKIILPEIQFAIPSAKGCLRNGDLCLRALDTNSRCGGEVRRMRNSVKNMPDSIFFTSHIYMTLAILCRRRHKVAFYRRTESKIQFAIPSALEMPAEWRLVCTI